MRIVSFILFSLFACAVIFSPTDAVAANGLSDQKIIERSTQMQQEHGLKTIVTKKIKVEDEKKPQALPAKISKSLKQKPEGQASSRVNASVQRKQIAKPLAKEISNYGLERKKRLLDKAINKQTQVFTMQYKRDREDLTGIESSESKARKEPNLHASGKVWVKSVDRNPSPKKPINNPFTPLPVKDKPSLQRVVSSVPQQSNPKGGSGGGTWSVLYIDKAYIVTTDTLEQARLRQPFIARADWLQNQWVNAPPTQPPRHAS